MERVEHSSTTISTDMPFSKVNLSEMLFGENAAIINLPSPTSDIVDSSVVSLTAHDTLTSTARGTEGLS